MHLIDWNLNKLDWGSNKCKQMLPKSLLSFKSFVVKVILIVFLKERKKVILINKWMKLI